MELVVYWVNRLNPDQIKHMNIVVMLNSSE